VSGIADSEVLAVLLNGVRRQLTDCRRSVINYRALRFFFVCCHSIEEKSELKVKGKKNFVFKYLCAGVGL